MQAALILIASIAAAVLYGVVHDQLTARISIEYFTIGHPRLFANDSPTLHAIAWGFLATWWVGAALGALLAACARLGRSPKLSVRQVAPGIVRVMGVSAATALVSGTMAWVLSSHGWIALAPHWARRVSPPQQQGFLIDMWIHLGSYAGGAVGGVAVCVHAVRARLRLASAKRPAS